MLCIYVVNDSENGSNTKYGKYDYILIKLHTFISKSFIIQQFETLCDNFPVKGVKNFINNMISEEVYR